MARKKVRPRPPKARHSSRDGSPSATFRLTEVSRTLATHDVKSKAKAAGKRDDHAMAALVHGVTPLAAQKRIARLGARTEPRARRVPILARREVAFVIEHEEERVHGYRSDSLQPRIAPGSHRSWVPDVRVDLHRVRVHDLERRVTRAIGDCLERSALRLLLIHGKGLHSAGGKSVLAEAVVESLTSERHARQVRAFSTAPERLGGTGALAVELEPFLRPKR
jgi:DNA-nicking Smr family endonuclease